MGFGVESPCQDGGIALVVVFGFGLKTFVPVAPLGTVTTSDGVADELDPPVCFPAGGKNFSFVVEDESHEACLAHVGFGALGQQQLVICRIGCRPEIECGVMWSTEDRYQLAVQEQVEVVSLSSLDSQSDLLTFETASDGYSRPVEKNRMGVAFVHTAHVIDRRMGGRNQVLSVAVAERQQKCQEQP